MVVATLWPWCWQWSRLWCGSSGGVGSIEEEEYQLDPKYSIVFEPPRNKKQDDKPPRKRDGDDDLEPASKKMKPNKMV